MSSVILFWSQIILQVYHPAQSKDYDGGADNDDNCKKCYGNHSNNAIFIDVI